MQSINQFGSSFIPSALTWTLSHMGRYPKPCVYMLMYLTLLTREEVLSVFFFLSTKHTHRLYMSTLALSLHGTAALYRGYLTVQHRQRHHNTDTGHTVNATEMKKQTASRHKSHLTRYMQWNMEMLVSWLHLNIKGVANDHIHGHHMAIVLEEEWDKATKQTFLDNFNYVISVKRVKYAS